MAQKLDVLIEKSVQWNPIKMATDGPDKFGHINGVAILTGRVKFHDLRNGIKNVSQSQFS